MEKITYIVLSITEELRTFEHFDSLKDALQRYETLTAPLKSSRILEISKKAYKLFKTPDKTIILERRKDEPNAYGYREIEKRWESK